MHPNPAFRQTPAERNRAFARERGFGTLAVNGADGPLLAHVPFLLDEAGETAEFHLVRSNPIARLDPPIHAVIAVAGPDGYVSPDWYEVDDQVPTWNYVAVHMRGRIEALPADRLRPHLDAVSAHFETALAPKPPWHSDKMSDGAMDRMMRQILPFRLVIARLEGTWKLNQNKPDDVRIRTADRIGTGAAGQDLAALAKLMRDA